VRLSKAQHSFTHLIALVGFITLWITGLVNIITSIVFVIVLFFSFINPRLRNQFYLSQSLSTFVAILLVIYVLISVVFLKIELFDGILMFLIFTQVIKLLGKKGIRDTIQIYILSFFQFLAGSIATADFRYGITFIIYVVVSLWSIMIFSMRKESMEASSSEDPKVITPQFLSTTGLISLCILVFTALIFVSVPRMRAGIFSNTYLNPEALKSGFSDEVRLGQVGEIKLDNSPVMRVRIINHDYEDLTSPIYWRGIALDQFDGRNWTASGINYRTIKINKYGTLRLRESSEQPIKQEIVTEPIDTDIVFAANIPLEFEGLRGRRITEVNDSYILPGKTSYRIKYKASSVINSPSISELRSKTGDYPSTIESRYLQLPQLTGNYKDLALEITSDDVYPYDKVVSIERYLHSNMTYTRTLEKGTSAYPLDDFLFDRKAGHCEYFATTMVVLLRELGIPSRIVNGFLGGSWNKHGRFFLVRESDAHSWVEVYFSKYGWVTFDPTPESQNHNFEKGPFYFITSYIDYLRFRWGRYVVDFSQRDQINLFNEIHEKWQWQKRKYSNKSLLKSARNKYWLIALGIITLGVWTMFNKQLLRSLTCFRRNKKDERASIVYLKALSLLSKRGFDKGDFETAREFYKEVISKGGEKFKSFQLMTEKYMEVRFGVHNNLDDLDYLENLFIKFKKEVS